MSHEHDAWKIRMLAFNYRMDLKKFYRQVGHEQEDTKMDESNQEGPARPSDRDADSPGESQGMEDEQEGLSPEATEHNPPPGTLRQKWEYAVENYDFRGNYTHNQDWLNQWGQYGGWELVMIVPDTGWGMKVVFKRPLDGD